MIFLFSLKLLGFLWEKKKINLVVTQNQATNQYKSKFNAWKGTVLFPVKYQSRAAMHVKSLKSQWTLRRGVLCWSSETLFSFVRNFSLVKSTAISPMTLVPARSMITDQACAEWVILLYGHGQYKHCCQRSREQYLADLNVSLALFCAGRYKIGRGGDKKNVGRVVTGAERQGQEKYQILILQKNPTNYGKQCLLFVQSSGSFLHCGTAQEQSLLILDNFGTTVGLFFIKSRL